MGGEKRINKARAWFISLLEGCGYIAMQMRSLAYDILESRTKEREREVGNERG